MSDSLQPQGLQRPRLPCSSVSPGLCSNSCPIKSMMPSNYLILCHTVLLLSSVFPSTRVFSNELALCIRQQKYWSFSFSISSSSEYSGLISFRIHWFDLLAVQGCYVWQALKEKFWRKKISGSVERIHYFGHKDQISSFQSILVLVLA